MSTFTTYAESVQAASSSHTNTSEPPVSQNDDDGPGKKKKPAKRRKVNHACLYCRRSHMTCDEGRPCQRCIKREIGHLCHDERRHKAGDKPMANPPSTSNANVTRGYTPQTIYQAAPPPSNSAWPMSIPQNTFLYQPETLGNEFSVLTDFLETLDEGSFFTAPTTTISPALMSSASFSTSSSASNSNAASGVGAGPGATGAEQSNDTPESSRPSESASPAEKNPPEPAAVILPAATKTEKVIRSKYEAGLLKPYNYVKGYARLSRWMDRNVSQESKQQILQPLSVLRPKFRAIAQSLKDIDLVFIEEAFERLLLDYDRVFSAMGVPACLWRRTGEIYKGNREFTELVGVDGYMMRDGRLCIYELMAEESAVNYWEKYGHVAFDSSQKAVLTSCVLRVKKEEEEEELPSEEGFINCCFSFTIRRDKWGIPSMIVGNFIKC
ncbi:hypothetical protein BD779DRAFT_1804168 [Infundibulicybe gibba]|nr:hypothetical protein BD779DRAFT_1804168 [Infundibulicybe gibba]